MPRIVAGFAGSLSLKAPLNGTRPTSDRVREGIFSALEARDVLVDARVLDLYAGSGALGLEAISRGAVSAILVDKSFGATTVIKQNVAAVLRAAPRGAQPSCSVVGKAVHGYLSSLTARAAEAPTLVFLDPPYELDNAQVLADLELLASRVAAGALLVLERSARTVVPEWPAGIELDRSRTYGDTVVFYLVADGIPDSEQDD